MKPARHGQRYRDSVAKQWLKGILILTVGLVWWPASAAVAARGIGEGHPSERADLSPAQRRLMARRAARLRAVRDGLSKIVGAPRPDQIRSGEIHIQGQTGSFRMIETQELPDGRWRAVVELTLAGEHCRPPADPIDQALTDYLQFRAGLLLSKQRCLARQDWLERQLAEAAEPKRPAVETKLQTCRADLAVIDRALADLEAKTVTRLSPPTTASKPSS